MMEHFSKSILLEVAPEDYFYLKDQTAVRSLTELLNFLKTMSDDVFSHHVNFQKNDFANWIGDVFHDYELANDILNSHSKEEMIICIQKRLEEVIDTNEKNSRGKNLAKETIKTQESKNIEKEFTNRIRDILENEKRILEREKEIEAKERMIEEAEQRIEERLNDGVKAVKRAFFTKDFVQGMIIGALVIILIAVIYWRIFL